MSIIDRITTLNGDQVTLEDAAVESLKDQVYGQVLSPGDPGYDDARKVWNSMIDKYPALIARCSGTADVVHAVNFAREHNLLVAVRGGGHNVAGNAVCDEGLLIDLSGMKGIHVEPANQTVRAQAGVTWGEFDRETQLHGLMTPGGVVTTTGIAGLTLAGGMASSRRKLGLTCDNLISAEVVTANGDVLRASEKNHADLFWAIRGGGGNFGIVTSFEFKLHRLGPDYYLAAPIYSLDDAPDILPRWRSYIEQAPDEVTSDAIFWGMQPLPGVSPDMIGTPILILAGFYVGPADRGEQVLKPLREFGTPLLDLSHVGTYLEVQSAFDPFFPDTQRYYWKSLNIDSMSDDVLDSIIALAHDRPSANTLFALRTLGGAISRVPEDATAYGNRQAGYNLSIDTTWDDPADDERMVSWTRQAWSQMRDMTSGGVYLNFAGLGEENETLARAGYGENYPRLQQVKRRYDPGNLFRGNINIPPEA